MRRRRKEVGETEEPENVAPVVRASRQAARVERFGIALLVLIRGAFEILETWAIRLEELTVRKLGKR